MATMEPNPPRKPKENRPFYAPPEDKPIAVQIINEARSSLKDLKTKRPYTPREDKRTLFGPRPLNASDNRPPSAFSLDSRHFDPESRPVSGTRLCPLDHKPSVSTVPENVAKLPSEAEVESLLLPPRPPNDASKQGARKGTRTRVQQNNSVDVAGSSDGSCSISLKTRSNSLTDESLFRDTEPTSPETDRRAHSGPKERSPIQIEERGEGDGKEAPPFRAPSAVPITPAPPSVPREVEERLGSGGTRRSAVKDGEERKGSGGTKRTPVREGEEREGSGGTRRTPVREGEERVGSGGSRRTLIKDGDECVGSGGKRTSSAGSRLDESSDEAIYNNQISPLLEEMLMYSQNKDSERLVSLSEDLYQLLTKHNLLGKQNKQRSRILKSIFKMLDLEEPKLLLSLARLILAFRVGGNNLLNVCKLVFKVSRNEKNDPAFLEGNILDLLLETMVGVDVISTPEALIYCLGALKFLTGNATIAKQLVNKECIEKLSTLLSSISKLTKESGQSQDQLGNVLVQLTAALRNLADATSSRDRILHCRLLNTLCIITESFFADGEIVLNVSRIFSKVTLHSDCCLALAELHISYKMFLHLLRKHLKRQDIVVRVCFILGNMTAKNDEARLKLYQESKCLDVILSVLKTYLELDIKSRQRKEKKDSSKDNGGHAGEKVSETEDVLVKVVRVIANISINETVGPQVAASNACVELLLSILECKEIETSEELVLNTVACINNLSYFCCKNSAVSAHQIRIIDCLIKLILSENMMKSIVEVCRVFGNLTRQKAVRDYLHKEKVDVLLITLLDSGDKEVVYIACGVLINFMVDEEKRAVLKTEAGITKLVEVLRDFGRGDWELAAMVCQTLWNYSGKITSSNACFGVHEAQDLTEILIDFLDKESAFDPDLSQMDEDFQDYIMETWETQFCPVADQLLQRIESHGSNFEALPISS